MRILLVEDEPSAARMLAKGLREQTYAVEVASDGEAGAYRASVNEYDLIILDLMLPRKKWFRGLPRDSRGRIMCADSDADRA